MYIKHLEINFKILLKICEDPTKFPCEQSICVQSMCLTWSINISPSSLNWSLVYNFDYESIGMDFHEIHYKW